MKTIKQIADELGVSKQAISYRLKQLEATKENGILAVKENGVLVVSLVGESLIKSAFTENNRQTFGDKQPPKDRQREQDILAVLQTTIYTLQEQLEVKDRQLESKDRQIDDLTATIKAQAQSINADRHAELAEKLQLDGGQLSADEQTDMEEAIKANTKRSFIGRIFKNKKAEQ